MASTVFIVITKILVFVQDRLGGHGPRAPSGYTLAPNYLGYTLYLR